MSKSTHDPLFTPLHLPCGVTLKNRIIKSAMSDSLGDGTGHPTNAQNTLYATWAQGGLAASIVGEVQSHPAYAEKPGNLVLEQKATPQKFQALADAGAQCGAKLWLQLGHAGAMAYPPTSSPSGPSALDLPGLKCSEMSRDEMSTLPELFARTAGLARQFGFGGVQIHAAHGFLLSQFLSPLFNQRRDEYGGSIQNRMRLVLETVSAVRQAVGPQFPIAIKLNCTDQLEGGLAYDDALDVMGALDHTSIDLIEISGGTYFPGAKSASDGTGTGPYFIDFAKAARLRTQKPIMVTGGFKTRDQAEAAITSKATDAVGLARALVIYPNLPSLWQKGEILQPDFPRFAQNPEGGVTAWYTMRMTSIADKTAPLPSNNLTDVLAEYEARDRQRAKIWLNYFGALNAG